MTLIVWGLTCALWSTVWVFIKLGVADVPPVTFAACRLFVALLVLVPIAAVRRIALPRDRRDWVLIGGTGVLLLGVNYALLYWGMQFVSSGLAAVLQALTPVFAMVFAHLLLTHQRITPITVAALALGIAGVAVIFADQLRFAGWQSLWGSSAAEPPIAMMLGAAILDETLSARVIAGTICILVSVGAVLESFRTPGG